jgi:hypothetical protein
MSMRRTTNRRNITPLGKKTASHVLGERSFNEFLGFQRQILLFRVPKTV